MPRKITTRPCPDCGRQISWRAVTCRSCHTARRNRARRRYSLASYAVDPDTECWIWQGSTDTTGYGQWWNGERLVQAHRAVYEAHRGPIPPGLVLDHICPKGPNRRCVNPDHVEPVSEIVNIQRGRATKVGPEQVAEIRALSVSMDAAAIAPRFGLHPKYVRRIIRGKARRDVA